MKADPLASCQRLSHIHDLASLIRCLPANNSESTQESRLLLNGDRILRKPQRLTGGGAPENPKIPQKDFPSRSRSYGARSKNTFFAKFVSNFFLCFRVRTNRGRSALLRLAQV
jgi:hypothetical protein